MIISLATRATNYLFYEQPHREMKGLKGKWINFLRNYPSYYQTLYQTHTQPTDEKLVQIHLEPTNGCNLKCVTCNNINSVHDKGRMALDLAYKVMDEAWDEMGPAGTIGLFIRGESVIDPNLPDMIAYARQKGFKKILLSTNIMLLTPERARKILEAGLSELRLSVDAVDAETFETTRAGSRFDVIVNNLESLHQLRLGMKVNCYFRLHASLHRNSLLRIPEFMRRWSHMIEQFRFTVAVNQGGLFPQEVAQKFSGMKFATATTYQIPCRILFNYVGVTWDGKLTSCCVDYREKFVTGHIDQGIRNGFTNDKAQTIKQAHLRGDFGDLCGKCGFNNALVDWFEDEVNDYVVDHMADMLDPKKDQIFQSVLDKIIKKFDDLSEMQPKKRNNFLRNDGL